MASAVAVISGATYHLLKAACFKNVNQNSICTSAIFLSKHWLPKWRKLRSQKVIKVELPDYEENTFEMNELSPEEIRSKMKEKGIVPPQAWTERPIFLSTTGDIFDPYVPPEGDGKVSFITKEGAKQKFDFVGKKSKSMMAIRKLRKFDDSFEVEEFLELAQDVYMKAHNAMMNVRKDKEELSLYVTERAYAEMIHNAMNKTIRWKMIGLLEPFRLVQARTNEVVSSDTIFSQLTVRIHSKQMLAVYDRFGRLMYGSEILGKDVLEYVIFEKYVSHKHGSWRMHAKIIPDWMPPKDPVPKTYRMPEESPEEPPKPTPQAVEPPPADAPALATA